MSELNDMGRTEDISLGLNLFASIGFAERSYGSDRDATLLHVTAAKGWEPGGPGRLFLLETGAIDAARGRGLSQLAGLLSRRTTIAAISRSTCSR